MFKKGFVSLLIIGVIVVAVGLSAMIFAFGMGMWSEKPGYKGGNFTTINASALDKFSTLPASNIKVDKINNTVEFYGSNVSIPMIASPENGTMYSFGIYSLVNPMIIVHKGAKITVRLVNADDDMYHGIVVTSEGPPYPYMGTMMFDRPAFDSSYIPPLPEENGGWYSEASSTFVASAPGTYYYICQVLGHASKGMYGKLVILGS